MSLHDAIENMTRKETEAILGDATEQHTQANQRHAHNEAQVWLEFIRLLNDWLRFQKGRGIK